MNGFHSRGFCMSSHDSGSTIVKKSPNWTDGKTNCASRSLEVALRSVMSRAFEHVDAAGLDRACAGRIEREHQAHAEALAEGRLFGTVRGQRERQGAAGACAELDARLSEQLIGRCAPAPVDRRIQSREAKDREDVFVEQRQLRSVLNLVDVQD